MKIMKRIKKAESFEAKAQNINTGHVLIGF